MQRRTVLSVLVGAGSLLAGGLVAIPSLLSALAPALGRRRAAEWRPLGPAEAFPVGRMSHAAVAADPDAWPRRFERRAVFVWRPVPGEFVVFSRNCTDLSCPLNWDDGAGVFLCPCHGGIFARDGEVMAGPPGRPMYRYAVRVRDGAVEIDVLSVPLMA